VGAEEGVERLIADLDQVIEYFNKRRMDLPDGFFDRKAQFVINGATFDSLLSATPDDPLIMMLARGPAGYRFTAKALQHALPDATIARDQIVAAGDPLTVTTRLSLSGTLRGTGAAIATVVNIALRLGPSGRVAVAEASIAAGDLQKIRDARLRP
jgi:hypothetical protein